MVMWQRTQQIQCNQGCLQDLTSMIRLRGGTYILICDIKERAEPWGGRNLLFSHILLETVFRSRAN